jgi:hypothetical protein
MTRRAYGLTLLACVAGAGLALWAVTRTWSVEVTARTGMSALRTVRTGADVAPWVAGLALACLAGAGALLATAGRVRRVVGVLLALAGAGVTAGVVVGRAGLDPGTAGPGGTLWPVAGALGGALVVLGGVTAARYGQHWPAMSARYDRKSPAVPSAARAAAPARPADHPLDHRAAWDALDRGDDPTT